MSDRWPIRLPSRSTVVLLAMAGAYVGLALLSRTKLEGRVSLVWPPGGVAILWFLVRGARLRSVDTAVLSGCAFASVLISHGSVGIGVTSVVVAVTQATIGVALLRRWCPDLLWVGGQRTLDSPAVLARIVASLVIATTVGASLGTLGLFLTGNTSDLLAGAFWFGRNFCAAVVLVILGLMVGHRLRMPHPRPPVVPRGRLGKVELLVAMLFTSGMYTLAFSRPELPATFLVLLATVWVGSRFPPLLVAWHSLGVGILVVAWTMRGGGVFAQVEDPRLGSLLAQGLIATLVLTGMALSLSRAENRELAAELRAAEAEAVYHSRLLGGIVDSVSTGVLVVDSAGAVTFRNAAAAATTLPFFQRAEPGRVPDVRSYEVDGKQVPRSLRPAALALRGETVPPHEAVVRDGGEYVVTVSASPLPPDAHTGRARAVVLFQDTTQEASRRAELAAFAGVVAHDLRNPLAAIDGWTEMIEEDVADNRLDPGSTQQYVDRIRSSAQRMNSLIDDLLDHATSRDRTLDLTRVDVGSLVAEVAAARSADAAVRIEAIPPVRADRALVRQVLDNLVGNAVKYVTPGETPAIEVCGRVDGSGQILVTVADRGIGLPLGEHDKVFGEFHRAHARQYEGHGLGLAICRRIIARHGGTIVARDNPAGSGTVFEFTLPAADEFGHSIEQMFDSVQPSSDGGRMGQAGERRTAR